MVCVVFIFSYNVVLVTLLRGIFCDLKWCSPGYCDLEFRFM